MDPTQPPKIGPRERARRQRAVDIARGSVRLEGFILCPEIEALNTQYVNGEITREDGIRELDKLFKK